MMAITHAAIAVAGTSLILGTADPFTLGLAILGSQLPDLDSTTSVVGQICYPLSSWIEDRYPHRTITHSLLASAILTAIAVAIGFYFFQNPPREFYPFIEVFVHFPVSSNNLLAHLEFYFLKNQINGTKVSPPMHFLPALLKKTNKQAILHRSN